MTERKQQNDICNFVCAGVYVRCCCSHDSWRCGFPIAQSTTQTEVTFILFASLYIYFCCGYLLFVSDLSLKHKCFFLIFCVECVCFVASNLRFFRRCQDLPIKTKKIYLFCDVPKYIIFLWSCFEENPHHKFCTYNPSLFVLCW